MKKKIMFFAFGLFMLFGLNNVYAGSLSINGNSSVYVNSNVTVSVNFNNIAGRFVITSSNQNVLAGSYEDFFDNQTSTFSFTAKSAGSATITVSPVGAIGDYDNDSYTGGSRSLTINVVNKNTPSRIDVNKTYSKNNYLTSLGIEGYSLTPNFDKETLEYTVTLNPGTESVNVTATKEDNNASIKGSGEVNVSEGINTIEVVVTAENGNERTYVIKASVEEKDPIEVKIGNSNYRVVKKQDLLNTKDGYTSTTVKINDIEVPALYNEVTKVTLVGLKDEAGNINLYSYDTSTGEYKEYKEITFDLMNLYIQDKKDSKYKKVMIKINNMEIPAYELDGISDYYLLYATNTVTGNEGYYLYDKKENSVQRYNTELLEKITNEKDKYFAIIIVLSCVCFLSMLFLLVEVNRDSKREN